MKKAQDRQAIVKEISRAARLYKQHLVGKRFLYVFDNRYIEVLYKKQNFKHLTGVDTNLTAKKFFDYAIKNQLQANQIFFSSRHPYALCKKKLKHILEIISLAYSESFMLEEIVTQTKTYKFGTTELNFSLCMNKEYDQSGNEIGDCYIVQSLRDEDCFNKSKHVYPVTHIFSRENNTAKKYTTRLFVDSCAQEQHLPTDIAALIDESLIE